MAYEISYSDSLNKGTITVEDNTLNEETSIKLPGRYVTSYGQAVAENFLHLLENFANTEPPQRPVEGQLWYDSTQGVDQLKVYDGTNWIASGGIKKAANEPEVANSSAGDLWVNTDRQQVYLFTGSSWILVGPEFSDGLLTGTQSEVIIGSDDAEYSVLTIRLEDKPAIIISAQSFIPKTAIAGFRSGIRAGVNITSITLENNEILKYYGNSEKAENLVIGSQVVPAVNFLRGDQESKTDFKLKIKSDEGLELGSAGTFRVKNATSTGVIENSANNSSIDFRLNNGITTPTVLKVDAAERVGINNTAPEQELDINGNLQINRKGGLANTGKIIVNGTQNSSGLTDASILTKGGMVVSQDLNVGGNITLVNGGQLTTGNILPNANSSRTIGSVAFKYDRIYSNTFFGNLQGNVTGTVSGRSGSTDRLASATTFAITGDVQNSSFEFDGQTGGSVKTFDVRIANSFISNKEVVYDASNADELLLNVTTGTTGVYRITKRNFLKSIPLVPPGAIMPYGGIESPEGWLLCDGSLVSKSDYGDLWLAIGHNFRDPSLLPDGGANTFAIPDMRGRFPLGVDTMGGVSANRVTGSTATYEFMSGTNVSGTGYNAFFRVSREGGLYTVNITIPGLGYQVGDVIRITGDRLGGTTPEHDLDITVDTVNTTNGALEIVSIAGTAFSSAGANAVGNSLGSQTKTIAIENLPEHEHDLEGESGTQYYGIRIGSGEPEDDNAISLQIEPGLGGTQGIAASGGVRTSTNIGTPLDVMNPYLAVNYIIYTGQ